MNKEVVLVTLGMRTTEAYFVQIFKTETECLMRLFISLLSFMNYGEEEYLI